MGEKQTTYVWLGVVAIVFIAILFIVFENGKSLKNNASASEDYHIHLHLNVFIHGKEQSIPEGVGMNKSTGQMDVIHTENNSGVVHVEADIPGHYTLGQFFDEWGVTLTNGCIGEECSKGDNMLRVYENGTLVSGDPRDLELKNHDEVVVTFGLTSELPNPIPSSYQFPLGE